MQVRGSVLLSLLARRIAPVMTTKRAMLNTPITLTMFMENIILFDTIQMGRAKRRRSRTIPKLDWGQLGLGCVHGTYLAFVYIRIASCLGERHCRPGLALSHRSLCMVSISLKHGTDDAHGICLHSNKRMHNDTIVVIAIAAERA